MTRRAATLAALFLLAATAAPTASAQSSLPEALENFQFDRVDFVVSSQIVEIRAVDFRLTGAAASDLRKCIDSHPECPIQEFRQGPVRPGNGDGEVTQEEIDRLRELVQEAWRFVPTLREGIDSFKAFIRVDDRPADAIALTELRIDGARGLVTSQSPIDLGFALRMEYRSAPENGPVEIAIERVESDLTIAKRIVIQPAPGWRIVEESVRPTSMSSLFSRGNLDGSQAQFEGTEPLTFTLEKSGAGALMWVMGGAAIVAAAGLTGLVFWKKRQKP